MITKLNINLVPLPLNKWSILRFDYFLQNPNDHRKHAGKN